MPYKLPPATRCQPALLLLACVVLASCAPKVEVRDGMTGKWFNPADRLKGGTDSLQPEPPRGTDLTIGQITGIAGWINGNQDKWKCRWFTTYVPGDYIIIKNSEGESVWTVDLHPSWMLAGTSQGQMLRELSASEHADFTSAAGISPGSDK